MLGDWWEADAATAKPLLGLPGLHNKNDRWQVHRSMLPLLEDRQAQNILTPPWDEHALQMFRKIRDDFAIERGFKLRETQHQAIHFAMSRRGTLIGDEMRLGKTVSAAMTHMGQAEREKLVVVAPLMARGVWLGWLKRIYPGIPIGLLTGKTFDRVQLDYPIIFAHYDILSAWQTPIPIGTLIFDEAHYLTNSKTKRSLAAGFLSMHADRVIALTGTPIWDRPRDLWHVLGLIAPAAWGSFYDFGMRYGAPVSTAYGMQFTGLSNAEELRTRLSEVMIRRLWKDVHDDLPPITRSVLVAEVDDRTRRKLDIMAAEMKADRTSTIGHLASYRAQLTSIKLGLVVKKAKEIIERGESVVIWTWHRDFAEKIAAELVDWRPMHPPYLIHGEIDAAKREDRIGLWKASPRALALIATMAVGQVAIDLSHAHINIFAEIDYTPAMIGQAEMRSFDPSHPLDVIFVVADHIIDQRIVRALVSKLSASDPLGLAAATDSIDALRASVLGVPEEPDLVRFLDDVLMSG